jgi:hypothetical protein
MGPAIRALQVMSPDRLRGRVMALYSMMFIGMSPIGPSGWRSGVKDGAPWTVGIGGSACHGRRTGIRATSAFHTRRGRELIQAQGVILGEPPCLCPCIR